jgi:GNAT superfamily N-acetyltransferase
MPTSDESEPAREFFYLDKRRKQDAELHDPIVANGDQAAARAIARKVAKDAGLSDKEIAALGLTPKTAKAWDESQHPRDPAGSPTGGQFTGGGGGESAEEKPKKKVSEADFRGKIDLQLDEEEKEKFFEDWNEHIEDAPEEFRAEFMGGLPGTMKISLDYDGGWAIAGQIHDEDGNSIGVYRRIIDFETNEAEADFFEIDDEKQQGQGIGKRLMAANVAKYQELGLDRVKVHANINVGGYAWARYGYVPHDDSWRGELNSWLNEKIEEAVIVTVEGEESEDEEDYEETVDVPESIRALIDSDDPKAVWAIADSKYGKDLLINSDWYGELNLRDKETMERFNAYVGKKAR